MKRKLIVPLLFLLITAVFAYPFLLHGKLPIPSDTIIGLYHPFRDLYAKTYPNGIPYKNFLITDPVRQQYPWRSLAIDLENQSQLPLWNPYSFGGTPLMANFQSATLYPLNMFLMIFPFAIGWSLLVLLQPLLAGLFLYFYLRRMRLSEIASLLGGVVFAFCGFSVAWLEWNTIVQIALWLPLILLAKEHLLEKFSMKWMICLIFAQCASFFAGHIQIFFYVFIIEISYLIARVIQITRSEKQKNHFWLRVCKRYYPFVIQGLIILVLIIIQLYPTIQFISLSARNSDQLNAWLQPGWFIPWQNLIQFVAPDFFGNPTTLNYWGVWNYGEFIGYIGIFPLIMALFSLFSRRDRKTLFFGTFFFLSLIFSLPTIFAQLPYILHLPFLSTSQPTRLLFITDFCLSVLSALGLDYFIKSTNKQKIFYQILFLAIIFVGLWYFVFSGYKLLHITPQTNSISKHNLYFPTGLFVISVLLLGLAVFIKQAKVKKAILILLVALSVFDLFRFANKFIPFTDPSYLFPPTAALSYLQNQPGQFRIMSADSEILPPNFPVMYRLQSIEGYDPLYLQRYGELMASIERNKPDISAPFGFNRIITIQNTNSRLLDLLGVKYILSLSDLKQPGLTQVFVEGQTKVYENKLAYPRAFFATNIQSVGTKEEAIQSLFDSSIDLHSTAIVEGWDKKETHFGSGSAEITSYQPNAVVLQTKSNVTSFLVLTDTYYPTWHVLIDNKESTFYRTDYNFRGVILPKGNHTVAFYDSLF